MVEDVLLRVNSAAASSNKQIVNGLKMISLQKMYNDQFKYDVNEPGTLAVNDDEQQEYHSYDYYPNINQIIRTLNEAQDQLLFSQIYQSNDIVV